MAMPKESSDQKSSLAFNSLCNAVEKQKDKTRAMLINAMENVERKSRQTKEKLTYELRSAMVEVEKKRMQTKTMLTKATKEILCAMEETKQSRLKNRDLKTGRVIAAEAVPRFSDDYEYNATCGSYLELLFFQKFWISLSKFVPKCVMPCTLTMLGLVINLLCCSFVLYYSPSGTDEIPSWVIMVCSAGIFLYQTLDALDGKQAIKLQNTHLEELADHGSDSLSTSFVILATAAVMQLGDHPIWMMIFCFAALIGFHSTHWQTHVTNVVVFGKIDVTEAQCSIMLGHLLSAVYGQSIWHYEITFLHLEVRHFIVIASVFSSFIAVAGNLHIIYGAKTPLDSFAYISRRKGLPILYPAVPLSMWLMLAFCTTSYLDANPCLFCMFYGVLFTKVLVKLQVSTLGNTNCELWDSVFFGPLLLALNQHLCLVPSVTALLGGMVFVTMDLLRFVTYLVWDVCEFQDIYVFTLKHPVGHPQNRAGSHGLYMNGLNNEEVKNKLHKKNQ